MASSTLALYRKFAALPMGKALFTRALCLKAPYFGSIRPQVVELESGYSEYRMKKRRAVQNHIGTVHAIAMCNLCELAAGTVMEVSLPDELRWIPKGMEVKYLAKAETDVRAVCRLGAIPADAEGDWPVTVDVLDTADQRVCQAVITMYLSRRKSTV